MTIKYGKLIVGFDVVDSGPEPEVREKQPLMSLDEVRRRAFSRKEEIELKLHNQLGGKIEVKTECGFIDLLTDTEIIENKKGKNGNRL